MTTLEIDTGGPARITVKTAAVLSFVALVAGLVLGGLWRSGGDEAIRETGARLDASRDSAAEEIRRAETAVAAAEAEAARARQSLATARELFAADTLRIAEERTAAIDRADRAARDLDSLVEGVDGGLGVAVRQAISEERAAQRLVVSSLQAQLRAEAALRVETEIALDAERARAEALGGEVAALRAALAVADSAAAHWEAAYRPMPDGWLTIRLPAWSAYAAGAIGFAAGFTLARGG